MAIYNIFDFCEDKVHETSCNAEKSFSKERIFSSLCARLLFLVLLIVDICWGAFSLFNLLWSVGGYLLTFGKVSIFRRIFSNSLLSLKRSLASITALLIAIFSPPLGIMFLCIYFFVYDRSGVNTMIPKILQDQFKEIFPFE